jgi:hypothetical protein
METFYDPNPTVPAGHLLIQMRRGADGFRAAYYLTAGPGLASEFAADAIQRAFEVLSPLVYKRLESGPQTSRILGGFGRPGNDDPFFSWRQSEYLPTDRWGTLEPEITAMILEAIAGPNGEYIDPSKIIVSDLTG